MKKRLNILYVVNVLRETSSPLHEHVLPMSIDHNIVVCSYRSIETELPPGITCFSGDGNFLKFFSTLKKAVGSEKFDIIHFHAPYTGAISLLYFFLSRGIGNARTVYTVHSSYANYNIAHLAMLYFVFLSVRNVVHCSQASYDSFSEKIGGLFSKRRTVIANGVNLQLIETVLEEKRRDEKDQNVDINHSQLTKIITIGRLLTIKNHSLLLRSLAKINNSNFSLQIIGTGPLLDALKSEAKDLQIDSKVNFTGVISREDVYSELAESDLFISTSTLEGLPLSVLEALACGCPVILSDIPAHREILDQQGCVQIVGSNDTAGFVTSIDQFFALSAEQMLEISSQCRKHVFRNHSMQAMNEKYVSLYENSLNS